MKVIHSNRFSLPFIVAVTTTLLILSPKLVIRSFADTTSAPISTTPQIKYYGLWDHSARDWGADKSKEYISKTSVFSNIAYIESSVKGSDPSNIDPFLDLVRFAIARNMKVAIGLNNFGDAGAGMFSKFYQMPYPKATIEQFLTLLTDGLRPYRDSIAAFFLPDEPYMMNEAYWRQVKGISPPPVLSFPTIYDSNGQVAQQSCPRLFFFKCVNPSVYERLDHVAKFLKGRLPQIPVANNNSFYEFNDPTYWSFWGYEPQMTTSGTFGLRKLTIPPSVDWVGFDMYLDPAPAGKFDVVVARLNRLKAIKSANQKMFLIPDAAISTAMNPDVALGVPQAQIVTRIQEYRDFLSNNSDFAQDVVAIFPYYYWNLDEQVAGDRMKLGMEGLPDVKAKHQEWAKQIVNVPNGIKTLLVQKKVTDIVTQQLLLPSSNQEEE